MRGVVTSHVTRAVTAGGGALELLGPPGVSTPGHSEMVRVLRIERSVGILRPPGYCQERPAEPFHPKCMSCGGTKIIIL